MSGYSKFFTKNEAKFRVKYIEGAVKGRSKASALLVSPYTHHCSQTYQNDQAMLFKVSASQIGFCGTLEFHRQI